MKASQFGPQESLAPHLLRRRALLLFRFYRPAFFTLVALLLLLFVQSTSFAGSANWEVNANSGDSNTAMNWTAETVPNGAAAKATFAFSHISDMPLSIRSGLDRHDRFHDYRRPSFTLTISGQHF